MVVGLVWFLCFLGAWLLCFSVALPVVWCADVSEPAAEGTVATGYTRMGRIELTNYAPLILDPPHVRRAPLAHGRVVLHRGLRACSAANVVVLGRCDSEFGKNAGKISA